ncbi:unnamed protein product [Symbiodinium natans]|uniref:Uncharacterized protein n=1 Tax=Symbiodinium natans TaxID=878477 RepID=A0A812N303_9DINO|nr:unnamed protein product [Symbiodinium natans]
MPEQMKLAFMAISMACLSLQVTGVRPARSSHDEHLSDLALGNRSNRAKLENGDCASDPLSTTVPAFRQVKVPGQCKRTCIDKSDLKVSMGSSVVSGLMNGALLLNPGLAPAKLAIYGGLYFSGAIPDWNQHDFCTQIVSSIVITCPRYQSKGAACPLDTSSRNPHCEAVYKAGLKGKPVGESEFKCAIANWWDACCNVRAAPADSEDSECRNCGQDMYFCTELPG